MTIKFHKCGLDNDLGNIKNFRIMSEKFKNKNNDDVVLEIGINHRVRRTENKNILRAEIFIKKSDGYYGDDDFDLMVQDLRLPYKLESILKIVNLIAKNNYTEIEFI